MSEVAIRVENLSKRYQIGVKKSGSFRETLSNAFRRKTEVEADASEFWALKDVSFEIKRGEAVGIIGKNGAGKSTLLKVLSRITEPTHGRIEINGRVASLLEVGTGFHPELTGRENIFMNGTILGMTRREIKSKLDEIIDFSGVGKFIDTPVKRYSSGMYVRLAFAVAAHLEPEILIIDEVLAVGDAEFQKKCLGKMGEVAGQGKTVLFVSHNMAAVENLCRKGILIKNGMLNFVGSQIDTIAAYLTSANTFNYLIAERKDRVGNGKVKVSAISIRDKNGRALEEVTSGQDIFINLYYETDKKNTYSDVVASISFYTQQGVAVFLQHNRMMGRNFGCIPDEGCFVCKIPQLPLPASTYHIGFSITSNNGKGGEFFDMLENATSVNIIDGNFFGAGEVPPASHGVCLIKAEWDLITYKEKMYKN